MERYRPVKIFLALIIVFVLVAFFHWSKSLVLSVRNLHTLQENALLTALSRTSGSSSKPGGTDVMYKITKQRNEISALLNDMRRKLGQMQCEKKKDRTSEQGGWCKNSSKESGGNHLTDKKFIPVLSKFLTGKTVGSFGDGPGAYKREILKLGEVTGYDAYDGAPYCEETSEGRVKFLDLSVPQYGLPMYDWIMSLEVAEHIPEQYEAVYLDNIFRHARDGIILSWAIPGQGGLQHVNNRPLKYVINVMKANGFEIDMEKSKILQKGASFGWLKRNTHVYVRSQVPKPDDMTLT